MQQDNMRMFQYDKRIGIKNLTNSCPPGSENKAAEYEHLPPKRDKEQIKNFPKIQEEAAFWVYAAKQHTPKMRFIYWIF